MDISIPIFDSEFIFKASRSGGKGGQNVNKVSTKVELNFNVLNSALLTDEQKQKVFLKLKRKINKEGVLRVVVQTERSQLYNKKLAIKKFYEWMQKCFEEEVPRIATKPGKNAKARRLRKKKLHAEKKTGRKKDFLSED